MGVSQVVGQVHDSGPTPFMPKFKKEIISKTEEERSRQGGSRTPSRADPLPGPSVQLEYGLGLLQQVQAVLFQEAAREKKPLEPSSESAPWGRGRVSAGKPAGAAQRRAQSPL